MNYSDFLEKDVLVLRTEQGSKAVYHFLDALRSVKGVNNIYKGKDLLKELVCVKLTTEANLQYRLEYNEYVDSNKFPDDGGFTIGIFFFEQQAIMGLCEYGKAGDKRIVTIFNEYLFDATIDFIQSIQVPVSIKEPTIEFTNFKDACIPEVIGGQLVNQFFDFNYECKYEVGDIVWAYIISKVCSVYEPLSNMCVLVKACITKTKKHHKVMTYDVEALDVKFKHESITELQLYVEKGAKVDIVLEENQILGRVCSIGDWHHNSVYALTNNAQPVLVASMVTLGHAIRVVEQAQANES